MISMQDQQFIQCVNNQPGVGINLGDRLRRVADNLKFGFLDNLLIGLKGGL